LTKTSTAENYSHDHVATRPTEIAVLSVSQWHRRYNIPTMHSDTSSNRSA